MPERLRFERELSDLGLRDYDDPQPQSTNREVVVGQKIILDVNDFGVAGVDIDFVGWEINGKAVKTYVSDRKGVILKPLTKDDLQKNAISFHWIEAGRGQTARFAVSGTKGSTEYKKELTITFDVKGPTLDYLKAVKTIGPCLLPKPRKGVKVQPGEIYCKKAGEAAVGIGFYIKWSWNVTMPANYGGSIKDIQTLVQGRHRTQAKKGSRDKVKQAFINPNKKQTHTQFDQRLTDAGQDAVYSAKGYFDGMELPTSVAAGKSFTNDITHDTPTIAMEKADESYSINDTFKYYILFKPQTPNSIWVTVGKIEWFWNIEAVKKGSNWVIKSGSKPKGEVSVSGAATSELPIYESNMSYNEWVDEP
jgi:hypothetical protein